MKYVTAVIVALGLLMLGTVSAQADDHEVAFIEAGPVDLSSYGEIPNAGAHLSIGSLTIGPGEWTIDASVRLFVGDPADGKPAAEQKNSQGCGLWFDGTKLGGAGGSSSLWTPVDGGKEVTFTEWWNGETFHPQFLVEHDYADGAMIELVCFIDASHSGVTEGDRAGMAATDVVINAVRTVEPEVCEWDAELLADDELCVEPDPDPDPEPGKDGKDGQDGTDGRDGIDGQDGQDGADGKDAKPATVPTAIPAGGKELPKTGGPGLLALGGLGLLTAGGGLLALRRKFG